MRPAVTIACLGVFLCLAGGKVAARTAGPDICPVPADTLAAAPAMPAFGAALKAGKVEILAVGTASTNAGNGAFPRMMLEALQAARPSVKFDLATAGARGLSTAELVPVLRKALSAHRPALVLWQTGTVDAVRAVRPDDMRDALEEGVKLVADAGADLMLIDPQYSRFLAENTDLDAYEQVLESEAAILPDVGLFPRFRLMQQWAQDGALDLETAPAKRRSQDAALVHACLGQALARYLLAPLSRAAAAREAG